MVKKERKKKKDYKCDKLKGNCERQRQWSEHSHLIVVGIYYSAQESSTQRS